MSGLSYSPPIAYTLSGGVWIVVGVFVLGFLAVIFMFSETGSEIYFHSWGGRSGDAPGSVGYGSVGKDPTLDVGAWTRGVSSRRPRHRQRRLETRNRPEDHELLAQLAAWRHGMSGSVEGLSAPPDPRRDHLLGLADARLQLVSYTDFECPSCRAAMPVVAALRKHFGNDILVVIRHFPIVDAHPMSSLAAEAVEAAGAQGRVWDMYRRIYRSRKPPTEKSLHRHAVRLGLDITRFERELRERSYARRVHEDFATGVRSSVNTTPTFFVNGIRHNDDPTLNSLLAVLNAVRDSAGRSSGGKPGT